MRREGLPSYVKKQIVIDNGQLPDPMGSMGTRLCLPASIQILTRPLIAV